MRLVATLLIAALLATLCRAQCTFGPTVEDSTPVDLRGWMDLPTGSGSWSTSGEDGSNASQRYSGTSSFLVSDFELSPGDFFRFTLRAGEEDGLVGLVAGLTCLPENSGTIFECDNELIPQVVWGRGTENMAPGLCAQIGRFPSLLECPVTQPQCTAQCENMNAPFGQEEGFGPGLPVYASQVEFHTGFLTCCDRFCDDCNQGLGWIADHEYDVVLQYSSQRLEVFFDGIQLFKYLPALAQEEPMPETSRIAFATKSHADVDFSNVELLSGGTAGCPADPWTAIQTFIIDECDESAYVMVDYGDETFFNPPTLQESIELSHTYQDPPPRGLYSVRLTLRANGRDFYKTIKAYVREPVSVGISAVSQGSCGFTGACHIPYGEIKLDYLTGGSPPYTLEWGSSRMDHIAEECFEGACDVEPLTYLHPGEYTVTATDSRGCVAVSDPVTIVQSSVSITSMTQTSCGAIDVAVSYNARCESLAYEWSTLDGSELEDPTQPGQSELGPGTYTVRVIDANSCSDTSSLSLSFGVNNFSPGDVIRSGMQGTVSWFGYMRYTEGTVSLVCPERTTRLYAGDLYDITSASFIVSGGSSAVCSLTITGNSGCESSVSPINYCLNSEYTMGECPPNNGGDDDDHS